MPEPELVADCSRCFGLCCVLLPFHRDGGFGVTKAGGVACHHLDGEDRCGIHATLREDGWPGCASFDCFGAGQHVSQVIYGGVSWRDQADLGEMAATLSVVRQLHEMLAHLTEVQRRSPDPAAETMRGKLVALTHTEPGTLLTADLEEVRSRVGPLLRAATIRLHGTRRPMPDDLAGSDLRERDLGDADLRGSLLLGADLRGADLARADLLGADLRGADVRAARLAETWFLTQAQLNTCTGDATTTLPSHLVRPPHWA